MRAYHIMMFLLIFNLMIWAVDTGLGIYDIDFSGGETVVDQKNVSKSFILNIIEPDKDENA